MGYKQDLEDQWDATWAAFEEMDDNSAPDDFEPDGYLADLNEAYSPKSPMRFDSAVQNVLQAALATCEQRGGEYQDSWGDEHMRTPVLDAVIQWVAGITEKDDIAVKRLVVLASFCDGKLSRMAGPFKYDTFEDLINYLAALAFELRKYLE